MPPPPDRGDASQSPPHRPQRRLARPKDDRVLSGVAAGIANHFGVDPVWVRVLFVIGTFMAGVGLVLYIVLAIAMPQVETSPPADEPSPVSSTVFWVGAAVALFLAGATVNVWPRGGLLVPIAIVAVGIALWQRPGQSREASTTPGAPPPAPGAAVGTSTTSSSGATGPVAAPSATAAVASSPESPPASGQSMAASTSRSTPGSAATPSQPEPASEPVWWTPPAVRPRPSWLGPLTLGIAILVAVVQAALDGLDVINVTPTQFFATGLLILGTGMVIGTWWGRAKWLTAPALVLAAGLLVVTTSVNLGIEISPNVRTGIYAGDAFERLPSGSIGDITLDLAEGEVPSTVAFDQGAGQLTVVVPWDADVELTATVGVGQVEVWEVSDVDFVLADTEFEMEDVDNGMLPEEWDAETARIRNSISYSFDPGQADMSFDVVDDATGELLGHGFVSSDPRSVAQGVDLSIESLDLPSPWSNGPTLDLDLGMGAGAIKITRGAPPDDLLASTLEER
ncbi:MAG TPA: PspC domain-containing protein [Nitriliruptoraceae bacterium]|nr:PspC domain-containing protein [Nitriliruptoraceae bacterium]